MSNQDRYIEQAKEGRAFQYEDDGDTAYIMRLKEKPIRITNLKSDNPVVEEVASIGS